MSLTKKIVLAGHFGVGKSSLIRRFVEGTFSEDYKATIGVHISKKTVILEDGTSIALIIWDLEGQDDIRAMRASYMMGVSGIIYAFDLSRPATFENLANDINYLEETFQNIPIKVVGNKRDLVLKPQLVQYADVFERYVDFFTSAKSGSRVDTLFSKLAKELV
ncbi:MAG: GTP-binding protein [Winogradskyella sp.]|nr:GTP-binding protein [Winogradskyella sp.]|tara:strand:- start:2652 stop:3140 length:489 start_codon:yes stop_codon:yes gene_type:complete